MSKIVFTGGGTAGHVIPAMALFPELRKDGWEIHYIGSYDGIERELVEETGIPYTPVSTGKLRRYFAWRNFTDPFRIMRGFLQARRTLRRLRPQLVFSKGGFVGVPVVAAASTLGIPVILHESDITPGLANRLAIRFAERILTTFPETVRHFPAGKAICTGTPIRAEVLQGDAAKGRTLCGFDSVRPILMSMGGSQGAQVINETLRASLDRLLPDWQIVHLCGKGNVRADLEGMQGYRQFDYVKEELPDLFAMSDLIVSRAGANTIFEILQLRLPNILIPLSAKVSRGDQIMNARSFSAQGFSRVIEEEALTPQELCEAIAAVGSDREQYLAAMESAPLADSNGAVRDMINRYRSI